MSTQGAIKVKRGLRTSSFRLISSPSCAKMSQYQCKFDPIQKTWSGKKYVSILNPQVSLGHVLLNMMDRDPDKVIQVGATLYFQNYQIVENNHISAIDQCR